MKRKQQPNLDSFFNIPKKSKSDAVQEKGGKAVADDKFMNFVDLTECEVDVPQREGKPTSITTTTEEGNHRNAFQVLMKNSKLIGKKIRAGFLLEFKDGKFTPEFIVDENRVTALMQASEKGEYWSCEVTLSNFRWFCFPTGYRDIQLHLFSNLQPSYKHSKATFQDETPPKIHPGLLKSMIQKGVRRRLVLKVMKLTRQLALENPMELLRRMMIICLEDAMLHPSLPIIAWLMVALAKGYIFHDIFSSICVLVLADFCISDYRDCYPPEATIEEMIQTISNTFASNSNSQPPTPVLPSEPTINSETGNLPCLFELIESKSWRTLIASLFIRASYGGMGFDRMMLEKYGLLWSMRVLKFQSFTTKVLNYPHTTLEDFQVPFYLSTEYVFDLCGPVGSSDCPQNPWGVEMLKNFFNKKVANITTEASSSSSSSSVQKDYEPYFTGISRELETALTNFNETPSMNHQYKSSSSTCYINSMEDIILEGIDFHCDWSLIPSLIQSSKTQLIQYFKDHPNVVNLDNFDDTQPTVEFTFPEEGNSSKQDKISANPTTEIMEKDKLEGYLRSVIWIFRSSVNAHKLWPFLLSQSLGFNTTASTILSPASLTKIRSTDGYPLIYFNEVSTHQLYEENTLLKKNRLAGLWKIICIPIKNYCEQKMRKFR
jgi:hypothetical protein